MKVAESSPKGVENTVGKGAVALNFGKARNCSCPKELKLPKLFNMTELTFSCK